MLLNVSYLACRTDPWDTSRVNLKADIVGQTEAFFSRLLVRSGTGEADPVAPGRIARPSRKGQRSDIRRYDQEGSGGHLDPVRGGIQSRDRRIASISSISPQNTTGASTPPSCQSVSPRRVPSPPHSHLTSTILTGSSSGISIGDTGRLYNG